jgi:O-acetyl-ADP-ribose deacetylase (regulator of RNase III)
MTDGLSFSIGQATLSITQGDLTLQDTDAIVNAANSGLMGGGGVDGAIHRAGGPLILEECKKIVQRQGRLPAGQTVITSGGRMKARHVIHTVGPIWHGGSNGEADLLSSAYRESLKLAAANDLASVSFPSISTGAYGYPIDKAARLALKEVIAFLSKPSSVKTVVFVLYGAENYAAYEKVLQELAGANI